VSFWIQSPTNYEGGDLPFFCNTVNSENSPGWDFAPAYAFGTAAGNSPPAGAATVAGGWASSIFDSTGAGQLVFSFVKGSINDGNFHNLVYVVDRLNGLSVFEDGAPARSFVSAGATIKGIGSIDTTAVAAIGQDSTGLYGENSGGGNESSGPPWAIDDLGVWRRALTPVEAAGIFIAGVNGHSFAGTSTLPPLTITPSGMSIIITWPYGALQSATNAIGPYTLVPGASSPYTNSVLGTAKFYRTEL
jgi:hypothetical protein